SRPDTVSLHAPGDHPCTGRSGAGSWLRHRGADGPGAGAGPSPPGYGIRLVGTDAGPGQGAPGGPGEIDSGRQRVPAVAGRALSGGLLLRLLPPLSRPGSGAGRGGPGAGTRRRLSPGGHLAAPAGAAADEPLPPLEPGGGPQNLLTAGDQDTDG